MTYKDFERSRPYTQNEGDKEPVGEAEVNGKPWAI